MAEASAAARARFCKSLDAVRDRLSAGLAKEHFALQIQPDYLAKAVRAYPERGGKRLRPALTYWFCGMVGGDPARADRAALAVELFHNWTLIHDDIIDDDDVRRGGPSCHVMLASAASQVGITDPVAVRRFGHSMGILAGDILHGWSLNALSRSRGDGVPADVVDALTARLCGWVTPQLISGEALDVEFENRDDLGRDEIENMLLMKTGVLLQYAAEAGVMIGNSTPDWGEALVRRAGHFAATAGMAFQIQDDVLGVFGDSARLGKPVGSDLREGKRTLLLVTALERSVGDDQDLLRAVLRGHAPATGDIEEIRRIMVDCGALAVAQERARSLIADAHGALDDFPAGEHRDILHGWLDYLVERDC